MDIKLYDVVTIPGNILGRVESLEPFLVKTVHGVATDLKPEDVVRRGVRICTLKGPQPWDPLNAILERLQLKFPWVTRDGNVFSNGDRHFQVGYPKSNIGFWVEQITAEWRQPHRMLLFLDRLKNELPGMTVTVTHNNIRGEFTRQGQLYRVEVDWDPSLDPDHLFEQWRREHAGI